MGEIIQSDKLKWGSEEEKEEEERAKADIWKYVFGFVEMAVVKCAIELGIADAIENHGRPMTLFELSSALSCSPPTLYRIMRFLVNRGIFKEQNDAMKGRGGSGSDHPAAYAQTPISRRLMRTGENSMAAFVLLESSPPMLAPWHSLSARASAQGGSSSAFEAAHGVDVWSYAAANPAQSHLMNEAMACQARVIVGAIVDGSSDVVFGGVRTLVDVGGGNGTALLMLVKACPWIVRAINFDLPHVVSVVAQESDHIVEHVGGDMFDLVPKADAAFLMSVLHDWGDDECIQILKKCREAIPEDKGKVIIVDAVIEKQKKLIKEDNNNNNNNNKLKDVGLFLDMAMMAHTNKGKERTFDEWAYVLGQAGFTQPTVRSIAAIPSVIEAFPA